MTSSSNEGGTIQDGGGELQLEKPRVVVGKDNQIIGYLPPQKLTPVAKTTSGEGGGDGVGESDAFSSGSESDLDETNPLFMSSGGSRSAASTSGAGARQSSSKKQSAAKSAKAQLTELEIRIKEIQEKNESDQKMLTSLLGREPPTPVQLHPMGVKKPVSSFSRPYKCDLCDLSYASMRGMLNHRRRHKDSEKSSAVAGEGSSSTPKLMEKPICEFCGVMFGSEAAMERHKIVEHQSLKVELEVDESVLMEQQPVYETGSVKPEQDDQMETQAAAAVIIANETVVAADGTNIIEQIPEEVAQFEVHDPEMTIIQFENEHGELQYAQVRTEELQQSGFLDLNEDQSAQLVIETEQIVETDEIVQ